jgi:cell fate (sporulation/competence/biofilm development) regulator YlbF (YheA/YmcA/DUF963 family)
MVSSGAVARISRLISLVGGSVSAVLGVVWSLGYVDRLVDDARALADARDALAKNIEALNAAAAQYFIANQQGDLIFILAMQGNARTDLATLIYRGNMLDREAPLRNMIGAMAVAGELNYRETYDAYEQLNAEAREHLDFATFSAVKAREQEIVQQGQNLATALLTRQFEIRKALNDNEAAQRMARVTGGVLSIASTVLLLAASIIAKREERAHEADARAAAG